MILNNNETEIPEYQLGEYAIQLDAKDFACRSKAKAKTSEQRSCRLFAKNSPYWEKDLDWFEPWKYSFSDFEVSKKVTYLPRHSQHVHREENLQKYFLHSPHWSVSKWKACLAGGGGEKRRFQHCTDSLGTLVIIRALQGHSGRNLIDPSLLENVIIIPSIIPAYLPRWMCFQFALNHQVGINTWRSKFEHKTVSILCSCWF